MWMHVMCWCRCSHERCICSIYTKTPSIINHYPSLPRRANANNSGERRTSIEERRTVMATQHSIQRNTTQHGSKHNRFNWISDWSLCTSKRSPCTISHFDTMHNPNTDTHTTYILLCTSVCHVDTEDSRNSVNNNVMNAIRFHSVSLFLSHKHARETIWKQKLVPNLTLRLCKHPSDEKKKKQQKNDDKNSIAI